MAEGGNGARVDDIFRERGAYLVISTAPVALALLESGVSPSPSPRVSSPNAAGTVDAASVAACTLACTLA